MSDSPAATEKPMTVLIADDDHNSASYLIWAVRSMNFDPVWVTNGQVAFQKAKAVHPVAILMDIMMPGFDGVMGIRLLRMNEKTKHIPIIVVSGSLASSDAERCREEGADDFLAKPFSIDVLRDTLNKYVPATQG